MRKFSTILTQLGHDFGGVSSDPKMAAQVQARRESPTTSQAKA